MARGQRDEIYVLAGHLVSLGTRGCVVDVVVVGARNQLRQSGRAAGHQQQGRRTRVDRQTVAARTVEIGQLREGLERSGFSVDEHMAQPRIVVHQGLGEFPIVESGDPVSNDETDRTADVGEVIELGVPMTRQAHHRDSARAQESEQCDGELSGIRKLQHHPVARRDTAIRQCRRDPVGAGVQFGERVGDVRVDDSGAVWPLRGGVGQDGVEAAAGPVARPTVFLGTVGGERHKTRRQVALLRV